ncbi:MAG: thioredoxin family protein [Oscillochloris sp.]|nr:thioredoxin family protein [Oscillochloris sp.]
MSIDRERFAQGMTYAEYKAQMTRNRERLEENEQAVELAAEDLAFFKNLAQPVHGLALVEDWCGDVINNLPVLAQMAAQSGKLDIRIFLRDQNLDLIDQYLKDGKHRSIPVFAFFDADFQPIGHWIERPALISQLMGEFRRELFAGDEVLKTIDPETAIGDLSEAARNRLMAGFAAFRKEHRALADREVLREIRALLGDAVAPATRRLP